MAVIDVFTYNGEKDILDIHFNVLDNYVDRYLIVEAKTTFTGQKKPLYWFQHEMFFKKFVRKVDYYIINENYSQAERDLAASSPNTVGADHWQREFLQKESIQKALTYYQVQDDDLLYIGDVDEIWEPYQPVSLAKLKLRVYAYYLNNLSNEEFWGTLAGKYRDIKGQCLNHLRSRTDIRTPDYHGCHFTSMGGYTEVKRKLDSSYTTDSYNTPSVQKALPERIANGTDYLGRDFSFEKSMSGWPLWLRVNRNQFKHLLK